MPGKILWTGQQIAKCNNLINDFFNVLVSYK